MATLREWGEDFIARMEEERTHRIDENQSIKDGAKFAIRQGLNADWQDITEATREENQRVIERMDAMIEAVKRRIAEEP